MHTTNVVYLEIFGVLHPSWASYRHGFGREPGADGHRKCKSVDARDHAVEGWPSARIVLTSTCPLSKGLAVRQKIIQTRAPGPAPW